MEDRGDNEGFCTSPSPVPGASTSPPLFRCSVRRRIFCRSESSAANRADQSNQLIFADAAHARHAVLQPCNSAVPNETV
jgi:hypothetical protein